MASCEEKFYYFGIKGRGFGAQVAAAYWDISTFKWIKVDNADWKNNKDGINEKSNFGGLPALEVGSFRMSQSMAIVRYLGKKWGKSGRGKDEDYMMSEMLIEESLDIWKPLVEAKFGNDSKEGWEQAREKICKQLPYIEKLEFTKEKTMGDMCLFAYMNMAVDVWPDLLKDYKNISTWYSSIASNEKVSALLNETHKYILPGYNN